MKTITKERLAAKLDGKDFHEPIRNELIHLANQNDLLIVYSDHLDFIRFDGAFSEYVYAIDRPFRINRFRLARSTDRFPAVIINAYRFGQLDDDEMHPCVYARLGKPVWDFECGDVVGKCAPFTIKERQDFGEGVDCFCRGIVIDLDEILPMEEIYEKNIDERRTRGTAERP